MTVPITHRDPLVLGDDFQLSCAAEDELHVVVDLTGATIFATFKGDLADTDEDALVAVDSVTDSTYFTIATPTTGVYVLKIPASVMVAGLLPDVPYYFDTKFVWPSGLVRRHVSDVVRFQQQVTRRTS